MGLIIVPGSRTSEGVQIINQYEGLAAAPPFLGAEAVNLGRITAPFMIGVRTIGTPGNLALRLTPTSSNSRGETVEYRLRDGELIHLDGTVDYDAHVVIDVNGCVENTGVLAGPAVVSPIPSALIRLFWTNAEVMTTPPPDQGAIMPAIRDLNIGAAATTESRPILVPASGRVSWIANYAAGVAGNAVLIQGGVEQTAVLAPFGTWTIPDLVAGQYVAVRVRNTGNAGAVDFDLKVVRT